VAWLALLPTLPATAIVAYRLSTGAQPADWGAGVGWGTPFLTGTVAMLAGFAFARGPKLQALLVGVTFSGAAAYGINVSGSYVATPAYTAIARVTWLGIPLTVAGWSTLSLLMVASKWEASGSPTVVRLAQSLVGRSWHNPRMAIGVWAPALLCGAAGIAPHIMFTDHRLHVPAWRGFTQEERWPYIVTAVWATTTFIAAAVLFGWWLLANRLVARRDQGRLATQSISSCVLAYFVVLLYGAAFGLWPEPVMDGLMAPSVAVAGGLLLEDEPEAGITRRAAWKISGALVFAATVTLVCWTLGGTPLSASIVGLALGIALPVLPCFLRVASAERDAITRRRSDPMDAITLPGRRSAVAAAFAHTVRKLEITSADLGHLLGAAWPERFWTEDGKARLSTLLDSGVATEAWPQPWQRAHSLRRLVALTALAQAGESGAGGPRHPSPAEVVVCICCEVDPLLPRRLPIPRDDVEHLIWRFRVWKLGADRLDGPVTWPLSATYSTEKLKVMFRAGLIPKLPDRRGEVAPRDSKTTCRKYYDAALPAGLDAVIKRWRGDT
jgi:hypothetical protein